MFETLENHDNQIILLLTPKLLWPIFCLFLKFGQTILVSVFMLNF